MKSKIYTVLFVFLFSISLSACSVNKIDSAIGSGEPGSSQGTDTSISGTDNSASSAESQDSSPMGRYKAVLQNEVSFISADDNHQYLLNNFLDRNSKYEGTKQATHFTVLDINGDQTPEVVLELSINGYPEQYEILHDSKGTVSGYNFVYRGFEMLKADGTYTYANGAMDIGVEKILSFQSNSAETETLGYMQSNSSGSTTQILYFIHNASATKKDFDAFIDQQNMKKDVQWYEFSSENIEKICADWNADSPSETTGDQKNYEGDWVIQKVLAYGTGTYSSDEANGLVGKKLSFSSDKASIFMDQPSDTAVTIKGPEYQETAESSSDFQADYHMSFGKLGISSDSVTKVDITGPDGIGGTLLIKDSSTMILIAGGTYFELVKQ